MNLKFIVLGLDSKEEAVYRLQGIFCVFNENHKEEEYISKYIHIQFVEKGSGNAWIWLEEWKRTSVTLSQAMKLIAEARI